MFERFQLAFDVNERTQAPLMQCLRQSHCELNRNTRPDRRHSTKLYVGTSRSVTKSRWLELASQSRKLSMYPYLPDEKSPLGRLCVTHPGFKQTFITTKILGWAESKTKEVLRITVMEFDSLSFPRATSVAPFGAAHS